VSASLLASASFSVEIEKKGQNCDKKQEQEVRNNDSKKVITFSSAGILTVPNELGSDANKLFDHGLSKKNKERETSVWKKNEGVKKKQIEEI
jgi:hypothetical protein